jgi:hypothetical protein
MEPGYQEEAPLVHDGVCCSRICETRLVEVQFCREICAESGCGRS